MVILQENGADSTTIQLMNVISFALPKSPRKDDKIPRHSLAFW